jgi:hypothetical protein
MKAKDCNITNNNGKKVPLLSLLREVGYSNIHSNSKAYNEARFYKRIGYSDLQIIVAVLAQFPLELEEA